MKLQGLLDYAQEVWEGGERPRQVVRGLLSGNTEPFNGVVGELKQLFDPEYMSQVNYSPMTLENGMDFLTPMNAVGIGAIKAFHGSPHKFDKFDMSKINSGSGAQDFGRGLYFSESPDIAKRYQAATSNPEYASKGSVLTGNDAWAAQFMYDFSEDALPKRISASEAIKKVNDLFGDDSTGRYISQKIRELDADGVAVDNGALYNVSLKHADPLMEAGSPLGVGDFLQFDKPLSAQSKGVKAAAKEYSETQDALNLAKEYSEYKDGMGLLDLPLFKDMTGESLYKNVFSDMDVARQYLQKHGVPGVRYLDHSSTPTGNQAYNYVVFDDKIPHITGVK